MPRDTQVFLGATKDAPKDYTIDKNVELILHSVHAQFRDNGAGGDWLPCVDLISDSGHTIARCCDPGVVVTAGDDAEVTWFPDVKPAAAAAPTNSVLAYAQGFSSQSGGDGVQSVLAGASANGSHAHVATTDGTRLSWSTSVTTNDTLSLHGPGTFLVWTSALWGNTDPQLTSQIMNSGISGIRHGPWQPLPFAPFVPSDGIANMLDYDVFHASGGGGSCSVLHQNATAFDSAVDYQFLTAVFLGTG